LPSDKTGEGNQEGGPTVNWKRQVGAMTLFVPDLGEAGTFYADAFGLDVQPLDADSAMVRFEDVYVFLRRVAAAAAPLPEAAAEAAKGAGQFAVIVDDVDAVCAEIAGRGVKPLTVPGDRPWGMRTAVFAAPGGYFWEIAQPLPE
jgi:catechol 2,3-dioxygenase-like lactoylglutathione lyase family enzyme